MVIYYWFGKLFSPPRGEIFRDGSLSQDGEGIVREGILHRMTIIDTMRQPLTHTLRAIPYVLLTAVFLIATENAMAGWYTDSLKSAPVIEIRGETADTALARLNNDRYIDDNIDYLLASNDWLIVNFCAYWCGDCNVFTPDYLKASQLPDYVGIRWATADVDGVRGNENLRKRFSIPGTPTVILFHKGEIVKDAEGSPQILNGAKGDKTYDDIIAYLRSNYRP